MQKGLGRAVLRNNEAIIGARTSSPEREQWVLAPISPIFHICRICTFPRFPDEHISQIFRSADMQPFMNVRVLGTTQSFLFAGWGGFRSLCRIGAKEKEKGPPPPHPMI